MDNRLLIGTVVAALALVACHRPPGRSLHTASDKVPVVSAMARTAAAVPADAMAKAKDIFATRCASCHGTDGRGDGAAAAALPKKPRDFSSEVWQQSVSDQHLQKIIVEGGAAVDLSPLMPPNPDLQDEPQVVNGLVQIVRNFGEKHASQ